jgi:hypothetical protein
VQSRCAYDRLQSGEDIVRRWTKPRLSDEKHLAYSHPPTEKQRASGLALYSSAGKYTGIASPTYPSKVRVAYAWLADHVSAIPVKRRRVRERSTPVSVSLQRLTDLLDESGEDDFGVSGPTQFAFKNALNLVTRAESRLDRKVKSTPILDSEGGISVTWRHGDRQVKLACPATPESAPFIYIRSPEGSRLDRKDVTDVGLAAHLAWLLNGDQSEQTSE